MNTSVPHCLTSWSVCVLILRVQGRAGHQPSDLADGERNKADAPAREPYFGMVKGLRRGRKERDT